MVFVGKLREAANFWAIYLITNTARLQHEGRWVLITGGNANNSVDYILSDATVESARDEIANIHVGWTGLGIVSRILH